MKIPVFAFTVLMFPGAAGWLAAQGPAPASLATLEASYAEDRAASLRRVLARYVDELEALERSLAAAGDTAGAARVGLERDRVLPALGWPAVAVADADEFAAFEEGADPPMLPIPASVPADLDGILKSLLPASPAVAAVPAPAASGEAVPGRGVKRILRMANAQLQGNYDPALGYYYWAGGRMASWTLSDLAPGSYRLVLRYACDEKTGGGKLTARFGGGKIELDVPSTGGWNRRRELVIGPFEITDSRADLILEPAKLNASASYLMDLNALLVQPVGPVSGSGKP